MSGSRGRNACLCVGVLVKIPVPIDVCDSQPQRQMYSVLTVEGLRYKKSVATYMPEFRRKECVSVFARVNVPVRCSEHSGKIEVCKKCCIQICEQRVYVFVR